MSGWLEGYVALITGIIATPPTAYARDRIPSQTTYRGLGKRAQR